MKLSLQVFIPNLLRASRNQWQNPQKFSLKHFIYLTAWNLQAEDYVRTQACVLSLQLKKIEKPCSLATGRLLSIRSLISLHMKC